MATGVIKKIVIDRGFGFIAEHGGPDHFFHFSELSPELPFDETLIERRVEFSVQQSPKGTRAVAIVPAR